jgi:hypothetical protein
MGGIDGMDQKVAYHKSNDKKKKWTWTIYQQFFHIAMVNAYVVMVNAHILNKLQHNPTRG